MGGCSLRAVAPSKLLGIGNLGNKNLALGSSRRHNHVKRRVQTKSQSYMRQGFIHEPKRILRIYSPPSLQPPYDEESSVVPQSIVITVSIHTRFQKSLAA